MAENVNGHDEKSGDDDSGSSEDYDNRGFAFFLRRKSKYSFYNSTSSSFALS